MEKKTFGNGVGRNVKVTLEDKDGAVRVDILEMAADVSRGDFADLIEWGQQWLKENPEIFEMKLIISHDQSPALVHNSVPITSFHKESLIAVVPISYHIGQGLDTPEEGS